MKPSSLLISWGFSYPVTPFAPSNGLPGPACHAGQQGLTMAELGPWQDLSSAVQTQAMNCQYLYREKKNAYGNWVVNTSGNASSCEFCTKIMLSMANQYCFHWGDGLDSAFPSCIKTGIIFSLRWQHGLLSGWEQWTRYFWLPNPSSANLGLIYSQVSAPCLILTLSHQ